nr:VENN motif pre-toxin domain-containing protein [Moraxella nasicaprae]
MARAASPELAYRIGQEFKENKALNQTDNGNRPEEQSANHLLAHAILGAATSYATGNDIATGAVSAVSNEAVAPVLSNYLYGTKETKTLSQEQKDTITSILNLATATTIYTATDGSTTDAVSGAEIGKVGVEWNADTIRLDGKDAHDRVFEAEAKRLFPNNPELQQQYIAQQNKKIGEISLAIIMTAVPTEIYEVAPIGKGFGIIAKGSKKVVGLFKSKGDAEKVLEGAKKQSKADNNIYRDDSYGYTWSQGRPRDFNRNLATHWNKHKHEFPEFRSQNDYYRFARNFVDNPPAGTLTKVRANGDMVFYQPSTNTFAIKDKSGSIMTLFKPDVTKHKYATNLEYFHAQ